MAPAAATGTDPIARPRPAIATPVAAKHERRAIWVRAHIDDIVQWLSLPPGMWRVEPLIVVRTAMITLHLRPLRILAIDASELEDQLTKTARLPVPADSESKHHQGINLALRPNRKRAKKRQ